MLMYLALGFKKNMHDVLGLQIIRGGYVLGEMNEIPGFLFNTNKCIKEVSLRGAFVMIMMFAYNLLLSAIISFSLHS